MKKISLILLALIFSCKDNTATNEKALISVVNMWRAYVEANPKLEKKDLPDSWYFHDNKSDANRLGKLVASGKKKAASGLYKWYKDANADLPKVGTKHIITDFDGEALAIIEIRKVDTMPFYKISKEYAALDMGTSENALEKWKKVHWDFFEATLKESNDEPSKEMLVVCEWFETVWPVDAVEY
ncbi:ASCH domain-containing protein [Winogradskyella litorisediminis]|uniref:ASCH domain-containing protein n=1 Tax=Winogradskyella litorisediminis TaxID=1156618 RepID=A0ABW3N973_9FLAO